MGRAAAAAAVAGRGRRMYLIGFHLSCCPCQPTTDCWFLSPLINFPFSHQAQHKLHFTVHCLINLFSFFFLPAVKEPMT